jgi:hypothetical protein
MQLSLGSLLRTGAQPCALARFVSLGFVAYAFFLLIAHQVQAQSTLPPDVRSQILINKVVTAVSQQDHAEVLRLLDDFKKAGLTVPLPLRYAEAQSAYATRDTSRALSALETYLGSKDRNSSQYHAAVQLYPAYERGVADTKDWNAAVKAETQKALMEYRQKWPSGLYVNEIAKTAELLENRAWNTALRDRSEHSFNKYQRAWPDGEHQSHLAAERERLDNAAWENASKARTAESFEAYLEGWPNGLHASAAAAFADELSWKFVSDANNIDAYRFYLNRDRQSSHKAEAAAALARLETDRDEQIRALAAKMIGTWTHTTTERDNYDGCRVSEVTVYTYRFTDVDVANRLIIGDVSTVSKTDWAHGESCPDDENKFATQTTTVRFDDVRIFIDGARFWAKATPLDCSDPRDHLFCNHAETDFDTSPAGALSLVDDNRLIPLKRSR